MYSKYSGKFTPANNIGPACRDGHKNKGAEPVLKTVGSLVTGTYKRLTFRRILSPKS